MLTKKQKEIIADYYENEILPLENKIYQSLSEEERKDELNYRFIFCPCWWALKPNKEGEIKSEPSQTRKLWKHDPREFFDWKDSKRELANLGVYPPNGFLYYDFDKPSPFFNENVEKTHGHRSMKKDCGHLLMKTELKEHETRNCTYVLDGVFEGEVCRRGLKPAFAPGAIKIKGGPITHYSNNVVDFIDSNEDIDEAIRSKSNKTHKVKASAGDKTNRIITDKKGGVGKGERHFHVAASIGYRLVEQGIIFPHIEKWIHHFNKTACNPPLDDYEMERICKQLQDKIQDDGIRAKNHLINVRGEDGPFDVIERSLRSLGWDFRIIRGGVFQYRKGNTPWESGKFKEVFVDASYELLNDVRLLVGDFTLTPVQSDKKKKDNKKDSKPENNRDMKVTMNIKNLDYPDGKIEKVIKRWACKNFYDFFRAEILNKVAWDGFKLAKKYGKGNWNNTLNDFIIWNFLDRFCQRTCPKDKNGINKYEGYGEQPEIYTRWQVPLIMLQAITRTMKPGYDINEFIWNIGPEGCFKNKSRMWLFLPAVQNLCYVENLTYESRTEDKTNRKRRGNVISEFDEAETIKPADLKRYFSAGNVKHEEKYEEFDVLMEWEDCVVFSTNKPDALPPALLGNRRFVVMTQYPLDKYTKRIYEDGESKHSISAEVRAEFFKHHTRLWTEAFALYCMRIEPLVPEGLESIRQTATEKASGLDVITDKIRSLFIDRIKRKDTTPVFVSEFKEITGKNYGLNEHIRRVHIELGGNGKPSLSKDLNRKRNQCYRVEDLKMPEAVTVEENGGDAMGRKDTENTKRKIYSESDEVDAKAFFCNVPPVQSVAQKHEQEAKQKGNGLLH